MACASAAGSRSSAVERPPRPAHELNRARGSGRRPLICSVSISVPSPTPHGYQFFTTTSLVAQWSTRRGLQDLTHPHPQCRSCQAPRRAALASSYLEAAIPTRRRMRHATPADSPRLAGRPTDPGGPALPSCPTRRIGDKAPLPARAHCSARTPAALRTSNTRPK